MIISEFFEALNSGGICLADNLNLKLDNGAVIHQFNLDKYGLVGYGTPDENHDCDAMGCPTIAHVVWKPD